MPELVIETAGGASQAAQIADWTERATTATQAATHSHFILKMANSLIKGEDKGIAEIRLWEPKEEKYYYNLLQHMDDECTNQDFMKHMIGVALHAGAFLLDGESAADIAKVEGKVRKAYQELKYYMTGFNDQILKAARKAKPSAFTYANKNGHRRESRTLKAQIPVLRKHACQHRFATFAGILVLGAFCPCSKFAQLVHT